MTKRSIRSHKELDELDLACLYRSVPVRNEGVTAREAGEHLILSVPLRKPRGWFALLAWFIHFSRRHRVELDTLGREVYGRCDGRTTVREIIEDFAQHYKLTFHESRLSIMMFVRRLLERGAVAVLVPEKS